MLIIFNALGIGLITFIIWWFWLAKAQVTLFEGDIKIVVEKGIYDPSVIQVKAGKKVTLRFLRKDPSPCAEWVVFPKLNLSRQLAINQITAVELMLNEAGEYEFTCQMNMYRGKLIVTNQ